MPALHEALLKEAKLLSNACDRLVFTNPVWTVYNTYNYAFAGYEAFTRNFASTRKKFLFLGMNPGPWGMAQTGVPFGEINAVREYLGIEVPIGKPPKEHPKRQIEGFECARSEVSGRRLWGLFKETHGSAENFFKHAFVLNYCPLAFLLETGANLTPDKLKISERKPLEQACDKHLRAVIDILQPETIVGVGGFATKCIQRLKIEGANVATLLHPSPASPMANRSWPELPMQQLKDMDFPGVK